jgi:hypothetical protein
MSDKERVDRLDHAIIEEILGMSEAEAAALVGEADVAASRKNLAQAKGLVGKLRLARAKADVALHAAGAATTRPRTEGRRVNMLRKSDPALDKKMTLAARSGTADAEADAASLDEDLAELDAWEAQDRDQS